MSAEIALTLLEGNCVPRTSKQYSLKRLLYLGLFSPSAPPLFESTTAVVSVLHFTQIVDGVARVVVRHHANRSRTPKLPRFEKPSVASLPPSERLGGFSGVRSYNCHRPPRRRIASRPVVPKDDETCMHLNARSSTLTYMSFDEQFSRN